MPTLESYNARKPLTRLIELTRPSNEIIDEIMRADQEAQEMIEQIKVAKKEYDAQIVAAQKECDESIATATQECEDQIATAKQECEDQIAAANKECDEVVESSNSKITANKEEIEEIIGYKDALKPIVEKYMNVIAANKFSLDLAGLTSECKIAVEYKENEIKEAEQSIEEITQRTARTIEEATQRRETTVEEATQKSEKTIEEATQKSEKTIADLTEKINADEAKRLDAEEVRKDTQPRLAQESDVRNEINSILNIALEKDGEDLEKGRIREAIQKLGVFTDDEIKSMLHPIMFPEVGLREIYEEVEGRGKSTKQLIQEAIKNQDKKIETAPEVAEKSSETKKTTESENNTVLTSSDIDKIFAKTRVVNSKKIHDQSTEVKDVNETPETTAIAKDTVETKAEEPENTDLKLVVDNAQKAKDVEETKEEYIKRIFNATDLDLSFNPDIAAMSKKELKEAADKFVAAGIDPKIINLNTIKYADQYIANIKAFSDNGMVLDNQVISKNPALAYSPTERVRNDIKLVHQSGLSFVKPNGKIAVLVATRETNKLLKAINLIGGTNIRYFDDADNLCKIVSTIGARMLFCEENGKEYTTPDGRIDPYIENKTEFESFNGPVDTSIIPSAKECNKSLVETVSNPDTVSALNDFYKTGNYLNDIFLSREQMDRFNNICDDVYAKSPKGSAREIVIDGNKFLLSTFQKNLSYLLSLELDATDEDLILASLFFNAHKTPDNIKSVVHAFDPNYIGLKSA